MSLSGLQLCVMFQSLASFFFFSFCCSACVVFVYIYIYIYIREREREREQCRKEEVENTGDLDPCIQIHRYSFTGKKKDIILVILLFTVNILTGIVLGISLSFLFFLLFCFAFSKTRKDLRNASKKKKRIILFWCNASKESSIDVF